MAKRIKWTGLTKWQKSNATKKFNKLRAAGRSEAYSRRIARAEATGKSRQQARGHKPKEHIERKEKEKAKLGGLTGEQLKRIQKWYEHFNERSYKGLPSEEEVIEFAQERGYKDWTIYRDEWNKVRAKYEKARAEKKLIFYKGHYILGEEISIDPYVARSGVAPQGDEQWLYYH